jgi:glyoxylase-like metal-dependent hydrolase (beta-lactamase superfamily II)
MRIHHLNCGTMTPLGRRMINGTGNPFAAAHMVCHCLLIETGEGLVLVDTGLGLPDIARPQTLGREFLWLVRPRLDPAEAARRQIERLGHSADDVRHIVLTHLDLDHAGGLADFPNARVHVHSTELDAARHPVTALERRRYKAAQWSHGPNWVEHRQGGEQWFGFASVRDLPGLPPELLLVPLAGHTRGHVGVAVDTGRTDRPRWLLHAGDAYFFHGQLATGDPTCPPGLKVFQSLMQADKSARLHNLRRLRELAANGEAEIFSAHDPVELDRSVTGTGTAAGTQPDPG